MRAQWYFDSFSGLIPVKVIRIAGKSGIASTEQTCTLEVTAKRGPFRKGETIITSGLHLVPWQAVKATKYQTYIRPYELTITAQAD